MKRISRLLPGYASVTSTLALVLALGMGGAYAAQKIGSKQIAKGAIKSKHIKGAHVKARHIKGGHVRAKHIKNRQVRARHLAQGQIGSGHIADGQVKRVDIDDAAFDGLLRGQGELVGNSATAEQGGFLATPIPLVEVPTMGRVELIFCGDAGQGHQIRVRMLSNDDAAPFFSSNYVSSSGLAAGTGKGEFVDHGGGVFGSGGGEPLIAQAGTGGVGLGIAAKWDFTLWRSSGTPRVAHITVSGLNGLLTSERCEVSAQGEIFG